MTNSVPAIQQLINLRVRRGKRVEPGATPEELADFELRFGRFFGYPVPSEYADFLRSMNGYEFNGLIIYGTHNSTVNPHASPLDLIEMNEVARDSERVELETIALLGEDSLGVLSFDFVKNEYQYRDRIGLDRVDSFESMAKLLNDQITKIEN